MSGSEEIGRQPPVAFIGLGSNQGDRRGMLSSAIEALGRAGVRVALRSSIYETEPVGVAGQSEFLNQVIACRSPMPPAALLEACLTIERSMGRVRTGDRGPRVIDLDLLLHGSSVVREAGLEIPHPRLHLRRFVLVPLAEIAPEVRHPVLGQSAAEMLRNCPDRSRVEPVP